MPAPSPIARLWAALTAPPAPLPHQTRPRALTAATVITAKVTGSGRRTPVEDWQTRALDMYEMVGPVWNAGQMISRLCRRVPLLVEVTDNGIDWVPLEPDDNDGSPLADLAHSDAKALRERFALLHFLTGDPRLYVEWVIDRWTKTMVPRYRIVSHEEVTSGSGGYKVDDGGADGPRTVREPADLADPEPGTGYLWRFHRPSPRLSGRADSAMRAAVDICETMIALGGSTRAKATSRAAAVGILFLPSEISPTPLNVSGDDDPGNDPFVTRLTEAIIEPIRDPYSAAAAAPIIVRAPSAYCEAAAKGMLHISRDSDYPEEDAIDKQLRRLAVTLDLPVEYLLGFENTNHWNGALISDDLAKQVIGPVCDTLCGHLDDVFTRPWEASTGRPVGSARITYDLAVVTQRPDRSAVALECYREGALAEEALLTECGFDPELDAPTDEERARRLEQNGGEPDPDTDLTPSRPAPGAVTASGGREGEYRAGQLVGLAEAVLHRARELAGARLIGKAQSDPDLHARLRSVPKHKVPATVGPTLAAALGAPTVTELISGCTAGALDTATRITGDRETATVFLQAVCAHAAGTLWDPDSRVPALVTVAARHATGP